MQSIETRSIQSRSLQTRSLQRRSSEAEAVAQAAYGSASRARPFQTNSSRSRALERSRLRISDGVVEVILTVLATMVFGLGWASLEMQRPGGASGDGTETGYAAPIEETWTLAGETRSDGGENARWTERPPERSKP